MGSTVMVDSKPLVPLVSVGRCIVWCEAIKRSNCPLQLRL